MKKANVEIKNRSRFFESIRSLAIVAMIGLTMTVCDVETSVKTETETEDPKCECVNKEHPHGEPCACSAKGTSACTCTEEGQPQHFVVTFDANNGTDPTHENITEGGTAIKPSPDPTRANCDFVYWVDSATGVEWDFDTVLTANITLKAKWSLNAVQIEMVFVAGGSFMMGQNLGSGGGDNTSPVHAVTLSDFYIGKYEVTQEQYQTVTGTNPSYFTANPAAGETQNRRPVEQVTWYDAVEFCNNLSDLEGLTLVYTITNRTPASGYPITGATVTANWSNNGYRLPTEAEWEYAAKGGDPTADDFVAYTFPGSDTIGDVAWYPNNSSSRTHEVGKKAPNKLGLYDMGGNVWEWCWDWYAGYSNSAQSNPTGPTLEDSDNGGRVRRGGSYNYENTTVFRSVYRGYYNPNDRQNSLGFRIARR